MKLFVPGVGLWVAQSLLAAALALGWISAIGHAKQVGARWPLRWLFPWAGAWRAGARGRVIAEGIVALLYALSWWLARSA